MSRRWATTAVFFVNGAVIGTFVAQIPWIQERFDLSKSQMGFVLVGMSIAVIVAFPVAGQLIGKHGSVRMTWLGGIADALAVNLVILAPHPLLVPVALFFLGVSNATMDVSMNAHGVKVERDLGRPIMSSLHAGWSFGGVIGAGFAAALAALGVDPRITVALASALLLTVVLTCTRRIGEGSAAEGEQAPQLQAALPRHPAARDAVPARDGDRGRDGRLGRDLPARRPRGQRRRGRARLRRLLRRHDHGPRVRRLGHRPRRRRSRRSAGAPCSPASRSPRCS